MKPIVFFFLAWLAIAIVALINYGVLVVGASFMGYEFGKTHSHRAQVAIIMFFAGVMAVFFTLILI